MQELNIKDIVLIELVLVLLNFDNFNFEKSKLLKIKTSKIYDIVLKLKKNHKKRQELE